MSAPPKILMATSNYWTSPFQVGSHHLARGFARAGWRVGFVADPISTLQIIARRTPELKDRLAIHARGGIGDLNGMLWAYVPVAIATPRGSPFLKSRWLHDNWQRLTIPNLTRVVREHGFGEVDVLYFDTAVQRFWLDRIPHRRSVLRVADRTAGFAGFTAEMQRLEAELAASVDLVVYSAERLAPYVTSLGARRTLHLPNGVEFDRYAAAVPDAPLDLAAIRRPIAIYVGAMKEWFDFRAVDAMAAALPDVSFVLIGPDQLARQRLAPRPNVHLLGRRSHDLVPSYLHHADVGLIPFDIIGYPELVNGVHPLKLYEYLACGLPVVAPAWDELLSLNAPINLGGSVEEQIRAIRGVLSVPHDPGPGLLFAANADWGPRVEALLERLL